MLLIGLTGSIGMGKSTTADMFRKLGVPVHDSDSAVHDLYSGRAAPLIEDLFPGTVKDGVVDRALLGARVIGDTAAIARLENLVHPLVEEHRKAFLASQSAAGKNCVILDIPLLFEIGGEQEVDVIIVVAASKEIQRDRVLARPGMTQEKFEAILKRQVPSDEKCRRAHFVIDTGLGLTSAERQVASIIRALSAR